MTALIFLNLQLEHKDPFSSNLAFVKAYHDPFSFVFSFPFVVA